MVSVPVSSRAMLRKVAISPVACGFFLSAQASLSSNFDGLGKRARYNPNSATTTIVCMAPCSCDIASNWSRRLYHTKMTYTARRAYD